MQFADYAIWQHDVFGSVDDPSSILSDQLGYWKTQLAGLPDVLDLPTDRPRPLIASGRGVRVPFTIPGTIAARVRAIAAEHDVTEFMVVHAALAVTAARLSATGDIAVGTPVSGRGHQTLDPVVGMFVNTLVLRLRVSSSMSLSELLEDTRRTDVDAFANADVPFEAVVEAVDPVRSQAFAPLAQLMFVSESTTTDVCVDPASTGGVSFEPVASAEVPAQRDLTVNVAFGDGDWSCSVVAAADLYDAASVETFAARLVRVLDGLTADPRSAVGDVDLSAPTDRALLESLPAPVVETANAGRTLVDLFEDTVADHSARTAVTARGRSLSYADLAARVDGIACVLVDRGVGPGDLVGIATARSTDLTAAILAVLKTGAAYLPLDLGNPVQRLAFIVGDADVAAVLTDAESGSHQLFAHLPLHTAVIDVDTISDSAGDVVRVQTPADAPAYVIYTSGSTGRPKGVQVTHRDVVTLLDTASGDFEFAPTDVWTMFHSYAFDFSVWELWGPLSTGARLVIVDRDLARDPAAFAALLVAEGVTVLNQTPSAFYQLVDARRRDRRATALRYVVFGGEALNFDQVRRWFAENPAEDACLVNMYGITETTVHVSFREIARDADGESAASFIGRPLSSLAIHILDDRLRPVPDGVPGEMYVAGGQLASGYLSRPGLTSTRFVANPFDAAGSRLYRTGDLARRIGTDIEYLGRGDAQVQLRGFRIEFGEIEDALTRACPRASAAAVRVVVDEARGEQLVGYLVVDSAAELDVAAIRAATGLLVPGYMVPDTIVAVGALPLTANGKLDRDALPVPEPAAGHGEYVAPESPIEEAIASVYAGVLGVDRVGVTDEFFDLGGNSLSAARLAALVSEAIDRAVSVRDVFDAPTVRDLAATVGDRSAALPPVTRIDPRPVPIPTSRAQRRMWFLNQFDPASGAYNIPTALTLTGDVDEDLLADAARDVVARHEVLRTIYPSVDALPVQEILPAAAARAMLDWSVVPTLDALVASTTAGFDVAKQLPIRGRVHRDDTGLHLAVTVHHIAMDGESVEVLLRDLLAAYAARRGTAPASTAPPVQYADYAIWQQQIIGDAADPGSVAHSQLDYWRDALAGLPAVTDLPSDRPRPAQPTATGGLIRVDLDETIAAGVDDLARRHGMSAFMVTHTAFAATVARLAATSDVVVATPVAGRVGPEVDDLIGMFVNTLLLRTPVPSSRRAADLLDDVRAADLDAFANDQVQFDDLIDEFAPDRPTSYQPLAQISFTYTDGTVGQEAFEAAGVQARALTSDEVEAKFDLTTVVSAATAAAPMSVEFIYAADLFDESTVQRFAAVYRRVLTAMIDDETVVVGDIDIVEHGETGSASRVARTPSALVGTGGTVEEGTMIDLLAQRDLDLDHPALICDGDELDYAEFEERTNAIARALLARGVTPEDVVAVGMERSIGSVLATWGVIKSGAAYVPIDPAYPDDRIAYMVDDSAVSLGITAPSVRDRFGRSRCEWIELDELEAEAESGDDIADDERNGSVRLSNLAYLIYTSGSTGRPKAVGVSHTGLADFVSSLAKITAGPPEDEPDTRILHVASPSFDASMFEMAWAIPAGHTLVIAPHTDFAGDALATVLERDEVTDMIITPSVLATVDPDRAEFVRNLATGGEACPPELVERWSQRGRRIFNCYGPTEATVWATRSRLQAGKPVTIGKGVDGFTTRVLDARLHEVPTGVVGELYLSTEGLARGYLGRPDLTATAFVADPHGEPGARMYATGDLVRIGKSGNLEFAGRADHQVKINGQRVELGEIEAVLDDQPGVAQSVVVGVDSTRGNRKHTEVVAYLVAKPGESVDSEAVLADAAQRLAAHMVPSQAIVIDEIPLTPAGKLDRTALPTPHEPTESEYVAPETTEEQTLARIVAGLLGEERVSVTESFFALGGDSIMSIQLSSAAKAAGLHLSPREIFELKTVRAMVDAAGTGEAPDLLAELPGGGDGEMPLPPIVSWMIEHSRHPSDYADFSQPLVFAVPREATVADLQAVIDAVAANHPMLRARLARSLTAGVGTVAPVTEIVTSGDLDDEVIVDAHRRLLSDLDPEAGSLVGAAVVTGTDRRRLILAIHHLGVDGVSWPILVEDLLTAWSQHRAGKPIALRPEETSARRIAHLLADQVEERAAERRYWLAQAPERPTSFGPETQRADRRWRDQRTLRVAVPADVTDAVLTAVPAAFGGTVDDVLLGALARAVRAWQRTEDIDDDGPITAATETHGRDEALAGVDRIDLARTVGWFTAITPIAVDASTDLVHAIKSAKDARAARPAGGVGFGVLRYGGDAELAARPLPTIMYNYFGAGSAPRRPRPRGRVPTRRRRAFPAPDGVGRHGGAEPVRAECGRRRGPALHRRRHVRRRRPRRAGRVVHRRRVAGRTGRRGRTRRR
ncbi:amino acid adenylation domain-containing protein [Gordonia humi]